MNDKNLIPLNLRTEEERKEIARLGGLASGRVRHARAKSRAFYRESAHEYLIKRKICEDEIEEYNAFVRHRRYLKSKNKLREPVSNKGDSTHRRKSQYEMEKNAQVIDLMNRVAFKGKSLSQVMTENHLR